MTNFIIYALPRSRTAWCSKFLTYKDHICSHEIAQTMRTPNDYKTYFSQPNYGSAETGASQGWWLIEHSCPGIKTVVIHRPVDEVVQSMMEVDVRGTASYDRNLLQKHMSYGKRLLDQISKRHDVLSISFHDLKKMETCESLFEHCLPYKFDIKWWANLKNKNIQINVKDMLLDYFDHKKEIKEFKMLCKKELISLRRSEPNNPLWKVAR